MYQAFPYQHYLQSTLSGLDKEPLLASATRSLNIVTLYECNLAPLDSQSWR